MNHNNENELVLVTGASGFIAGHIIKVLLEDGFSVRGTVRSLSNMKKYDYLFKLVKLQNNTLKLVEADLSDKDSWDKAVKGCDYVIHTANPVPSMNSRLTKDEQIKPAVNGMKYIMDCVIKYKVKKVVYTSSVAACGWKGSHQPNSQVIYCNQNTWTDIDAKPTSNYAMSKVLAEKTAWELSKKHNIPLTCINPSATLGPLLHNRVPSISIILTGILNGLYPRTPKIGYCIVDVRDVALAHLNAIKNIKQTNNKRYILSNGMLWFNDIAKILLHKYGSNKYNITYKTGNYTFFKVLGMVRPFVKKAILPLWDRLKIYDNTMSVRDLGIVYRPLNETIIDMSESLIMYGQIKDRNTWNMQFVFTVVQYFVVCLVLAVVLYLWK